MADTSREVITLTEHQRANIDHARGGIPRAVFIREAVRVYLRERYGIDLGPDAPVGGPRKPGRPRE